MTVLAYQTIKSLCETSELITPWVEREIVNGKSYGLSSAGYDITVGFIDDDGQQVNSVTLRDRDFLLAVSKQRIKMPDDLICIVHDKSSWAREGLAIQNTVLEPGWEGYITLELSFHCPRHHITIKDGDPIAQLIFHRLDVPTAKPYVGKYQNQPALPIGALNEGDDVGNENNVTRRPGKTLNNKAV